MAAFSVASALRSVWFTALLFTSTHPGYAQVTTGRVRHFDNLLWKQPYYRGPLKIGWSLGRTWYQGDLTDGPRGTKGRNSAGLALSKMVWPNLEVAVEAQYIRLAANDQVVGRGYRFTTRLIEATLLGRYYLERYHFDPALDSREQQQGHWYRPFVVMGVGEALWWAVATGGPTVLTDSTANGPEQVYPAYATVAPVGAGVGLRVSPLLWVAPELTYRFAFTDVLDDVGPRRGNPARNDGYWQLALRFQYAPPHKRGKQLH
ncbi:MAG: hypothetical protein H7330_06705 [Hymenobacteraceae bacterium]|nr:hypothetical protein [Hymenobacteraceae bacterium]